MPVTTHSVDGKIKYDFRPASQRCDNPHCVVGWVAYSDGSGGTYCARCEGTGDRPDDTPLTDEDIAYLQEKSLEFTGSIHYPGEEPEW